MANLLELIREAAEIELRLMESGGEITDEIMNDLEMHELNLRQKVDAYGAVLSQLDAREAHAVAKMREWGEVVNACDRARENLKSRLGLALEAMASNELIGHEYKVARQKNPPKVKVTDETKIPGSYLITKTETSIDKRSMLEAMKQGQAVPGAELEQTTRIVIKTARPQARISSQETNENIHN